MWGSYFRCTHCVKYARNPGLLDCHNSTRKCWKKLALLIMTYNIALPTGQDLKISRLFRKDQDFFFTTKIKITTFISRPFFMSSRCLKTKTKDSRLHPCVIHASEETDSILINYSSNLIIWRFLRPLMKALCCR